MLLWGGARLGWSSLGQWQIGRREKIIIQKSRKMTKESLPHHIRIWWGHLSHVLLHDDDDEGGSLSGWGRLSFVIFLDVNLLNSNKIGWGDHHWVIILLNQEEDLKLGAGEYLLSGCWSSLFFQSRKRASLIIIIKQNMRKMTSSSWFMKIRKRSDEVIIIIIIRRRTLSWVLVSTSRGSDWARKRGSSWLPHPSHQANLRKIIMILISWWSSFSFLMIMRTS